jgi:FkbH-like protein
MRIRLTATSNIPSGNPTLRPLLEVAELDFGRFGDWFEVLTGSGYQDVAVAWVLFFRDILAREEIATYEFTDGLPEALQSALTALDQRLQMAKTPTFVLWSAWRPDSLIRASRRQTPLYRVESRFVAELYRRAEKHAGLILLALDDLFSAEGLRRCFDSRNYYASRCWLSLQGLKTLAEGLAGLINSLEKPTRKVLVLDCDNTLWGGVIGENGLSGIQLGQDGIGNAYVDFQKVARWLNRQGILLAISSKNEESDVWMVFDRHPAMVLRREELAAYRIDWREKTLHLREIASELNLGLDSLVFWDDNALEREKVRNALPQVFVPEPPADIAEWPDSLASLDCLARSVNTSDDLFKNQQYQARAAFLAAAKQYEETTPFLASIGMKPRLVEIDAATLGRAAQLCAKTNQFNLRLIRHNEADIESMLHRCGAKGFLVALTDKFGDHGIIGLTLAVATHRDDTAFLDTFLLSCRAMGRHIEAWMLARLQQRLLQKGYRYLLAQYVPGERNAPIANFLPEHGFQPLASHPLVEQMSEAVDEKIVALRSEPFWCADLETLHIPHLEIFEQ